MWIEICCFCCVIVFNVDLMHFFLIFKSLFFFPFFLIFCSFFFFPFFLFLLIFSFFPFSFFLSFFPSFFPSFFISSFSIYCFLSFLFPFFHSFFLSVNNLAFVYAINYMEGIVTNWRTLDKRKKMMKKYKKDTMMKKNFFVPMDSEET